MVVCNEMGPLFGDIGSVLRFCFFHTELPYLLLVIGGNTGTL